MSRHRLDLDMGGNAEAKLAGVEAGIGRVARAAEETNKALKDAGGAAEEADEKLGRLASASRADQFRTLAGQLEGMSANIRASGREFVEGVIKDASTFEDAQSEMRFAFKNDWENVYQQVLKDATDLTFTFEETSRLASSLGRMKINPFGGTKEEDQLFMSRNGERIRALSVLQDTADAVGKSADDVVISLRNAMGGQWKSLQDRFDIPREKIAQWRKETDKLKEPQEKYNVLVKNLAQMFGGAGLEKAKNYTKAVAQIPDLLQQLRAGAGMAGLKHITNGVFDLVGALGGLVGSKEAMAALSGGFEVIGHAVSFGLKAIAAFVTWVKDLLVAFPWLPKVAAALSVLGAAFVVVTSSVLGFALAASALFATFEAIGAPVLIATFAALLPVLLVGGTLLVGIGLGAKAAADMVKDEWGGVGSTFQKINLIFKGVSESIASYNGKTSEMSLDTAEALQKGGLMETVNKIMSVFHKLNSAYEGFEDAIDEVSYKLGPVLIPMLDEMGVLFWDIVDALGFSNAAMRANTGTTDDWAAGGRNAADALISISHALIQGVRYGMLFARIGYRVGAAFVYMMEKLTPVIDAFKWLMAHSKGISGALEKALAVTGYKSGDAGKLLPASLTLAPDAVATPRADYGAASMRLANGAFRDAKGRFDATKGDAKFALAQEIGTADDYLAEESKPGGRYSPENLARMKRGRAPLSREAQGMSLERATAEFPSLAAAAGPTGVQTPAEAKAAADVAAANAKHEQALAMVAALGNRPIVVEIDKKEIARAVASEQHGVGGPI
jgi:hypothetical protein